MDKIGNLQFHVMCEMWGVDQAIEASKGMGMTPTDKQIEAERQNENGTQERWNSILNSIFKPKEDT